MADVFGSIRSRVSDFFAGGDETPEEQTGSEYVELNTGAPAERKGKAMVRTFTVEDFTDTKAILDALREGNTVAVVNIRPIKDKDMIELKRVVNKLKKTTDAIEGDIAGFGEDYIIVTPAFARIYRAKPAPKMGTHERHENEMKLEEY